MEPFAFIKSNKNLAPRDELRSQIWYVWLVGFEPTTSRVVNRALYPLSYNHTQAQNTRVVGCLIDLDFQLWKRKYCGLFFLKSGRTFRVYSRNFPCQFSFNAINYLNLFSCDCRSGHFALIFVFTLSAC